MMKHDKILKESSTAYLDESIVINILIFLPLECLMRCRCVCKYWATLVTLPYFVQVYDSTTKESGLIQLLIEDRAKFMGPNNLLLLQLDEAAACTSRYSADILIPRQFRLPLKFLDDFPDPSSYVVRVCSVCSVTGCIAATIYGKDNLDTPISCHIFNPVTGRHILVDDNAKSYRWDRCALLYVENSKQFKVLYFHGISSIRDDVKLKIQTIGSNLWRKMGIIPIHPTQQSLPTFVSGLYHWIDPEKHVIYSFNAEEEVFQQIQTPPLTVSHYHRSNLGLINGCLCVCLKSLWSVVDLWVRSESGDGKSWTKNFVLRDLVKFNFVETVEPLKCLKNGDVLILRSSRHAVCYNPTTRSRKYIRFAEKESPRQRAFSYIPTLRSVLLAAAST